MSASGNFSSVYQTMWGSSAKQTHRKICQYLDQCAHYWATVSSMHSKTVEKLSTDLEFASYFAFINIHVKFRVVVFGFSNILLKVSIIIRALMKRLSVSRSANMNMESYFIKAELKFRIHHGKRRENICNH